MFESSIGIHLPSYKSASNPETAHAAASQPSALDDLFQRVILIQPVFYIHHTSLISSTIT